MDIEDFQNLNFFNAFTGFYYLGLVFVQSRHQRHQGHDKPHDFETVANDERRKGRADTRRLP